MTIAPKALVRDPTTAQAVTLMGRVGYVARGIVYFMVGVSAAIAAVRPEHRPGGMSEALQFLHGHPFGAVLLLILAGGLACLAGWFTIAGLCSVSDKYRWPASLAMLGDAVVYGAFMLLAFGLALGSWGQTAGQGDRPLQSWVGWFLGQNYGRIGVGVAGIAVLVGGVVLAVRAAVGLTQQPLTLPAPERKVVEPVSRYGVAGRGIAAALIGAYLVAAAIHANPYEAHELGGALASLRATGYGPFLIGLFALAFIGSGVSDVATAFYRPFDPKNP